jgi:hypothetical protein
MSTTSLVMPHKIIWFVLLHFFNVCLYSATSKFFFSEEWLMRAGGVIMNSVNATLCNKFCTLDLQSDYLICQNEVLPLFAS